MNRTQQRKKPILDSYVIASVNHAGNKHDHAGRYATITLKLDTADYDEAREIRNALYRSAYHLNLCLDAEMGMQDNGNHSITFTAVHPSYKKRWSALEAYKRKLRGDRV